jgi:endonuclease-3
MLNLITSKHKNVNNNNVKRYKNIFTDTKNYLEVEFNGNKYRLEKLEDWISIVEKHIKNYTFNLKTLSEMTLDEINKCISKVGFHNKKSELIKNLCEHLSKEGFPTTLGECKKIKGFGLKMGLLYLNKFQKVTGISVDTHVHRISNRIGLVKTKNPEQTNSELEKLFDITEFGDVNSVFVGFGQIICTAIKPKCERCLIKKECEFGKESW